MLTSANRDRISWGRSTSAGPSSSLAELIVRTQHAERREQAGYAAFDASWVDWAGSSGGGKLAVSLFELLGSSAVREAEAGTHRSTSAVSARGRPEPKSARVDELSRQRLFQFPRRSSGPTPS